MKNWQETALVFREIGRLAKEGRSSALAVIVGLEGSAYRHPGAKLLVRDDGTLLGNVSGGCLEGDVREVGLQVIREGRPRLLHYDTSGREDVVWGLGVGCDGKVDVMVLPCRGAFSADATAGVERLTAGDERFGMSVVVTGESVGCVRIHGAGITAGDGEMDRAISERAAGCLREGRSASYDVAGRRVFTEVLLPPPRLVVCGAGDDSIPLVRLACDSGFRVTVVDHRPAYLAAGRFPENVQTVAARPEEPAPAVPTGPGVLAVVKFHMLAQDRAWVARFAGAGAPYIGLLGSRSRREEITQGLNDAQKKTVYSPVGLDIGAEGPEQIALSVVAEVMAVRAGRIPGHLRDRAAPIHRRA